MQKLWLRNRYFLYVGRNKFHLQDSTQNRIFCTLFNNFLSNNLYVLLKVTGRSGGRLYKMQIIPLKWLFVPFANYY